MLQTNYNNFIRNQPATSKYWKTKINEWERMTTLKIFSKLIFEIAKQTKKLNLKDFA